MLYIVSTSETVDDGEVYRLFETGSESFFSANKELLRKIIETHKMEIKNVSIRNNNISVKVWPNELLNKTPWDNTGSNYILLCKLTNGTFKLVNCGEESVIYADGEQLKQLIAGDEMANCLIKNGKFESTGTYTVTKNTEFEEGIATKYERYTTLSAAIGCKMSFEYAIENAEVKLKMYTGSATDVIIPSFVTSIVESAFWDGGIESITIDQGLKSIGSFAFEACHLSSIIIPKTVEFIGEDAFSENKQLVTRSREYKEGITVLNKNALIIDNYSRDE